MPPVKKNVEKLSIRLLRISETPETALRTGNSLKVWSKLPNSKIVLDSLGGKSPRWTKFLDLSATEKSLLENNTAAAVVFLKASNRWFAVSFGLGHAKIDPDKIEQDFGLLVTLNTVDPENLKSADARTPDENTVTRRSQSSRASNQRIFSIDIERDIIRGVSGRPKDPNFGTHVSGSDALSLSRKIDILELPQVCADSLKAYQDNSYQAEFGWVDKIKYVRDKKKISDLDKLLVDALKDAVTNTIPDTLQLAFPAVYDPDNVKDVSYRGFDNKNLYSDLDIFGYIDALKKKGIINYEEFYLVDHSVHEVDDNGNDIGHKWKIRNCFVYEVDHQNEKYILSDGKWYKIDTNLVTEVTQFFRKRLSIICRRHLLVKTRLHTIAGSQNLQLTCSVWTERTSNPLGRLALLKFVIL